MSNVKTIDDLTNERKARLLSTTTWASRMVYSIETWPCYNVINDLGMANINQIICVGCNQRGIASRLLLYGQPYNSNTIEAIQPDNRITYDKVRNKLKITSCAKLIVIIWQFFISPVSGFTIMSRMFNTLRIIS